MRTSKMASFWVSDVKFQGGIKKKKLPSRSFNSSPLPSRSFNSSPLPSQSFNSSPLPSQSFNSSALQNDAWKTSILFGRPILRDELLNFRWGNLLQNGIHGIFSAAKNAKKTQLRWFFWVDTSSEDSQEKCDEQLSDVFSSQFVDVTFTYIWLI